MSHHVHHFDSWLSRPKWKTFYELLCHDLDAITFPTEFVRREAVRIAPWLKSRAHVVPLVFDPGEEAKKDREISKAEARRHLGLPEATIQHKLRSCAGRLSST
jgi:hypothetical protein